MKIKISFGVLLLCMALLAFNSCKTVDTPPFARNGIVNNPVRDTLFIHLKNFEDEWVNVRIKTNDTEFTGRDQVTNGQVFFDIRHLPTGSYIVWIEFGSYYFPQHFWHERSY